MRIKTRAVKSRRSSSIPPSNPPLNSLPSRHQGEANEEYNVDGKDHGASEDTGSSQGKGYKNDDVGGKDDVYVDDEEKDEEDDEEGLCMKCDSKSGPVLFCSENGCPVAIHEVCMNCEPKFDETGKFYCPYCWYKREVARTKELRRKAMLAKKEFSSFICLRRDSGNKEKQEDQTVRMKGASVSTMAEKVNSGYCENGLNDDDKGAHHNQDETQGESISKEKSDEESIPRAHGFDDIGNGERIQEDVIENSSDSEDDEVDEDRWQIQPSSSNHLGIVEDTLHVSTKDTPDVVSVSKENLRKRRKEESVLPNAVGATMELISRDATSKVPAIEHFEFVSPDLGSETIIVHSKRFKRAGLRARPLKAYSPKNPSFQPSISAKDKMTNQGGKATTSENSAQWKESTKRVMVPTVGTEKRRRLNWTAEEEDMLKEGVRIFSTEVHKNIPWRKILEFGHHVFHATRTSVDLKDKWKNIMAKEAPQKQ